MSFSRTAFRRPRTHATMTILPLSAPSTPNGVTTFAQSPTPSARVPLIFRRLHRFQQMVGNGADTSVSCADVSGQDFEVAAWQLTYLCLAPKRVYVSRRPIPQPWLMKFQVSQRILPQAYVYLVQPYTAPPHCSQKRRIRGHGMTMPFWSLLLHA